MGCYYSREEGGFIEIDINYTFSNQFNMYAAIIANKIDDVANHLDAGFSVNYRMPNFSMRTPLHIAAETGSEEIIKLLIEHFANPNIPDVNGITPIFLAVNKRNYNCVNLLEAYGANLNVITRHESRLRDYIVKGDEKKFERVIKTKSMTVA